MTRLARDPSPLIEKFYQAALEPRLWESALRGIGDYTPMSGMVFSCCDISDLEAGEPTLLIDLDPAAWDMYRKEYVGICPHTKYVMEHHPRDVFYDYCHTSESEIKKSEYYSLLAQHWNTQYCMSATLAISDHVQCHLGVHRTRRQGHPLKDDVAFMNVIKSHVHRALQLSYRLTFNNAEDYFEANPISGNAQGLVILDNKAQVLFCNARADKILRQRDGLESHGQFIAATAGFDQAKLSKLIASALAPITRSHSKESRVIPISRRGRKRPLRVMVCRLPKSNSSTNLFKAALAIFIADPEDIKFAPESHLQQLYGLTAKEALLLFKFVEHTSLTVAAEQLGMAKNTARTHLKSICYKTETKSQTELIKLVLSS